jgi:AraC-like DNA-binding protein
MALPLDNFPLVRTSDLDQLRSVLATLFRDSVFEIGSDRQPIASSINYSALLHTRLISGDFGAAIRASFGEMQFFVQGVTLQGSGEQLTNGRPMSANVGGLLSPNARLGLHFAAGFEFLAVLIEPDALGRKLEALVGTPLRQPILFEVEPEFNHPAALKLRLLIQSLAASVSADCGAAPLTSLVEAEQAMMTWFLLGNRHNHSSLLVRRSPLPAPWQVRRAEEYIAANWDQAVTIERLADVTGASARSLFHAFKHIRGCSPMAFLRQVRLQRAWLLLNGAQGGDLSVTAIAYACGFGNLGHFARYFRAKFGEAPSAVLARARARRAD